MRETLYIRLRDPFPGAPTAHAIATAEAGDAGAVRAALQVREAPLSEVVALGHGRRVVVFVPGADVRLTSISVPAKQAAKVLQAAPFVLEDQLADDVDTLHFALGQRRPDGSWPVAVAARAQMQDWLGSFRSAGIAVDALVPETLALPWTADGPWSVLPEPRQVTVRNAAFGGFCCVPDDFEDYLALAGDEPAQALRVFVSRSDATDYTRLPRAVELAPGFGDPLEVLARHWRAATSINLLQGAYSQKQDLDRIWAPWRIAAGLAAATFVLGVAANGVEAWKLRREAARQEAANVQRFQQLFPRESRIVDLEAQVAQQLRALRSGGGNVGLFPLLQQAASGLAATPGLTLKTAQFREGALFLDLSGSDLQVLEQLRGWFAGHRGAKLEVQTADAGEGGVQIRLKLTPEAG